MIKKNLVCFIICSKLLLCVMNFPLVIILLNSDTNFSRIYRDYFLNKYYKNINILMNLCIFFFSENRSFEVHSPDCIHSLILRASDPNECLAWYNSLHAALVILTQAALRHANSLLVSLTGEIRHMGWLSRFPHTHVQVKKCSYYFFFFCFDRSRGLRSLQRSSRLN